MISVSYSEVPEFLRNGELFKSRREEDGAIEVPATFFVVDDTVTDVSSFEKLLSTLRYWKVKETPENVLHYAVDHDAKEFHDVIGRFQREIPSLRGLVQIAHAESNNKVNTAIRLGRVDMLDLLHKWGYPIPAQACDIAADCGHVKCLQYLHEHGYECNGTTLTNASRRAHLPCLTYLVEKAGVQPIIQAARVAIKCGRVHSLKYLLQQGVATTWLLYAAASSGKLDCLKALYEHGVPWTEGVMNGAASKGHLECMKFAWEHGCPWDATTTAACAKSGKLACLRYARHEGCPWAEDTCLSAVESGSMEILRYAHKHGCPWGSGKVAVRSVELHRADMLTYVLQHGCPWEHESGRFCTAAAGAGNLQFLRQARQSGLQWGVAATIAAASHGHLHALRYLHEQGCPWSAEVCTEAARHGKLVCLMYAHEQGCPWDASTVLAAKTTGHTACLEYALNNDCPSA